MDKQIVRLLTEREAARDGGDKLAIAIKAFLAGSSHSRGSVSKASKLKLHEALMGYCASQGWNGPAGSWVKDILAHEASLEAEGK